MVLEDPTFAWLAELVRCLRQSQAHLNASSCAFQSVIDEDVMKAAGDSVSFCYALRFFRFRPLLVEHG